MSTLTVKEPKVFANTEIAKFIGNLFSFNNSLKLYHWHVTGNSSYAQHIALDQAIASLSDETDLITETCYSLLGNLDISIPSTSTPSDIVKHAENFYDTVESNRELFPALFTQSIIDDYQEAIQQLLFRLKRLQ
ncbi:MULTISPECIES: DUF5856 family protein [unclassified Dysgonomonas]|uniref:DUF5856 family protein n=1 Tax=unclassified Dysgonomonas TaxID=2630389 RepID=UPI0013EA5E16|nr:MULTISPECIES: DUF5856 family protein [unclassified Dysgonomonas]